MCIRDRPQKADHGRLGGRGGLFAGRCLGWGRSGGGRCSLRNRNAQAAQFGGLHGDGERGTPVSQRDQFAAASDGHGREARGQAQPFEADAVGRGHAAGQQVQALPGWRRQVRLPAEEGLRRGVEEMGLFGGGVPQMCIRDSRMASP